jgi:hypothetical protein
MSAVGQTVYITKYALTEGILTAKVTAVHDTGYTVEWKGGLNGSHYFSKNAAFASEEEAQAEVRMMASRKIRTAERTLKKLVRVALNGAKVKPQGG